MEQSEERWAEYYEELDPAERLKIFNRLAGAQEEDALLDFRRTLYRERYHDPKHPDRPVDLFLWKCVYLPGLYKRRKMLRSPLKKEIGGTLAELHLENPEALSEGQKEILFLEFRNAARRYLGTCSGERYGSSLLGLKKAGQAQKRIKACEDVWMMSRGVARAAGVEEQMALWCDALYVELLVFDPDAKEHYEELESHSKK